MIAIHITNQEDFGMEVFSERILKEFSFDYKIICIFSFLCLIEGFYKIEIEDNYNNCCQEIYVKEFIIRLEKLVQRAEYNITDNH